MPVARGLTPPFPPFVRGVSPFTGRFSRGFQAVPRSVGGAYQEFGGYEPAPSTQAGHRPALVFDRKTAGGRDASLRPQTFAPRCTRGRGISFWLQGFSF